MAITLCYCYLHARSADGGWGWTSPTSQPMVTYADRGPGRC